MTHSSSLIPKIIIGFIIILAAISEFTKSNSVFLVPIVILVVVIMVLAPGVLLLRRTDRKN